jgi:hypothetical protein
MWHIKTSSNKSYRKDVLVAQGLKMLLHIILPVTFIIGQWKMKYRGNTNTFRITYNHELVPGIKIQRLQEYNKRMLAQISYDTRLEGHRCLH